MEHQLKRGQALVLAGPQGCGKTLLAREIATKHGGKIVEVDAHDLQGYFEFDNVLAGSPDVIIMDECPVSLATQKKIKAMLTSETVKVNRKYQAPVRVRSPHLIFCTHSLEPFPETDRRYKVIKMDRRPAQAT